MRTKNIKDGQKVVWYDKTVDELLQTNEWRLTFSRICVNIYVKAEENDVFFCKYIFGGKV